MSYLGHAPRTILCVCMRFRVACKSKWGECLCFCCHVGPRHNILPVLCSGGTLSLCEWDMKGQVGRAEIFPITKLSRPFECYLGYAKRFLPVCRSMCVLRLYLVLFYSLRRTERFKFLFFFIFKISDFFL